MYRYVRLFATIILASGLVPAAWAGICSCEYTYIDTVPVNTCTDFNSEVVCHCPHNGCSISRNYETCTGFAQSEGVTIPVGWLEINLGIAYFEKTCNTVGGTSSSPASGCQSTRARSRLVTHYNSIHVHYECDLLGIPCGSGTAVIIQYLGTSIEFSGWQVSDCDANGNPCCPPKCYDKDDNEIECPPTPTPVPCWDKVNNIPCITPSPTPCWPEWQLPDCPQPTFIPTPTP